MHTILVSNRVAEPLSGAMPGGLAAALYGIAFKSGAAWIGGSGGFVPEGAPAARPHARSVGAGTLVTVDLPAGDYENFYNGMSNSALWPVLHDRADLLRYEAAWFGAYGRINQTMADAVGRVLKPDSLIWVHDYHYFMLGGCLRRNGVANPVGFFLHTPFPTRSVLSCLPGHRDLMKSLAAYDVIGFQTADDLLRFRDYATNELAATMIGQTLMRFGDRRVKLGVFPIGIEVDRFAEAAERTRNSRKLVRMKRDLHGGRMVIGADRLDYSKGLPLRFQAYDRFLTLFPEERGRVTFLQITPPTRSDVESYQRIRSELASLAGDINARLGSVDWMALRYINEGFPPDQLAGFYRLSKVGCVTPLRDGMNLVAKEYVAAQDPSDPGVLVLSKFAGAAKELDAAVLVNPFDVEVVARSLQRALHMSTSERIERWSALMLTLRRGSLQSWYDSFLAALGTAAIVEAPFEDRSVA